MRVIAFVGPSGTGKSYRALWIAKEKKVNYIIDDGLLIGDNKVIAGFSAKKESTKVAAIKRACFVSKEHVKEVREAIDKYNPEGILILGTSEGMADTIRKALGLDDIQEYIHIEDVASKEEISKARSSRRGEGKHVIPVPTFEIKKTFSGYFMDKLKVLKKQGKEKFEADKTVVRPTYSYLGKYIISEQVLKDITAYVVSKLSEVSRISAIEVNNKEGNVYVNIYLIANYQSLRPEVFLKIQNTVKDEIERLTFMNVEKVNIVLKSLDVSKR